MNREVKALRELARALGVQLSFRDVRGHLRRATPEALVAVSRALGAEVDDVRDAPAALRAHGAAEDRRAVRPRRTRAPALRRDWGVFLPLYALQTERNLGVGDLTDLEALLGWTDKLGGRVVATLPLFAAFLDEPYDPSPYSPVSRLFYNELYVDPERAPEFERSAPARELATSDAVRAEAQRLRAEPLVDHRAAYALKREIIDALAQTFFDDGAGRLPAFLDAEPLAADYAAFRGRGDQAAERFHLYAQLLAHEQLAATSGAHTGAGLMLDLPLATHPDGFDVHRFADAFVAGVNVGAPPDDFFEGGQDWGARPIHPQRGAELFAMTVRKLMRTAAAVRIDHVMGLHRQYWIPQGMPADRGVYVRFPAAELYDVLVAEANRTGTTIVGEDLGTVPAAVRATMRRRGLLSTYVLQFRTSDAGVEPPPRDSAACLNTHDMEPFAAFWDGLPSERRRKVEASVGGGGGAQAAAEAALRYLARSDAALVLVNLEDLWGERRPQNEPGTTTVQRPNWQRKAHLAFERFAADPEVLSTLAEIASLREEEAA